MSDTRYDILFEPVQIGPVTAPNRFYAVPHATGHGWNQPHGAIALRAMKAEGGWGTVAVQITEIATDTDMANHPMERIWDDSDVPRHEAQVAMIKQHGSLAAIELGHGGMRCRNITTGVPVIGPSALPVLRPEVPLQARAMTRSDIAAFRASHKAAATRAKRAGYDILYVYAAHDISLLSNFLSIRTNHAQTSMAVLSTTDYDCCVKYCRTHWKSQTVVAPLRCGSALQSLKQNTVCAMMVKAVMWFPHWQTYQTFGMSIYPAGLRTVPAHVLLKKDTPLPTIATWTDNTLDQPAIVKRLQKLGVTLLPNTKMGADGSFTNALTGQMAEFCDDTVIALVGARTSNDTLCRELQTRGTIKQLHHAGDCLVPGIIQASVYSGHATARMILNSDSPAKRREQVSLGF